MLDQNQRLHCQKCKGITSFQLVGGYSDGSQGFICTGCEANGGVLHRCPNDYPFAFPQWLPLLLASVAIVCPKCKAAYDLGVKIEPAYPELGELLQAAGLVVGSIVLFGVVANIGKQIRRHL